MACRGRRAYDAVEQRHAQAKWRATRQRFHQAARRGAVEEEFVADTHVVRWHHDRHPVRDERNVANEGFIENGVDEFAVVTAAVGLAPDLCSFGRSKVAHSRRLAVAGGSRQGPIWIDRRIDPAGESCTLWGTAPHQPSRLRPHGNEEARVYPRNVSVFQRPWPPQSQGVDGSEPRPLSSRHRSAFPLLAGETRAHGAGARFSFRYFWPNRRKFFADQPGHSFCERQDALQNPYVPEVLRSSASKTGNWAALCWPYREHSDGGLPNLFGREAEGVHDCADRRAARDGGFPLGCKTEETSWPPLRKLLVHDGEGGVDQARWLAHDSGGLEEDIGVDRTAQIQPFRSYSSYFSAPGRQSLSRSLSPSALHFVAGHVEKGEAL